MVKRISPSILIESGEILKDLLDLKCPHVHQDEDVDQVRLNYKYNLLK